MAGYFVALRLIFIGHDPCILLCEQILSVPCLCLFIMQIPQTFIHSIKNEPMKNTLIKVAAITLLALGLSATAQAAVISFTGGTVTMTNGTTNVTNLSTTWGPAAKYEEAGFRVELIATGASPAGGYFGNYYGAGNDVVHGHWATGGFGNLTQIKITKIDGAAFDMNYFVLTSNTDSGGGAASGNERAYVHASIDGTTDSYSQLLPSENWGFPATQVFLGSQFDSVKAVWFDVANAVDCFGMDNFYINEAAPGTVPEPESLALFGAALFGIAATRRMCKV